MTSTAATSADFWQKSTGGSNGNNGPNKSSSGLATNGELQQYYWSSANPYYGGGRSLSNGNGNGVNGGVSAPAGNTSSIKRNAFPLSLPMYQNLPRARLREDSNGQGPQGQSQQSTTTMSSTLRYASNGNGSGSTVTANGNNAAIGYKLANNGMGAPPTLMNPYLVEKTPQQPQQQRIPFGAETKPLTGNGVWSVEADRLSREQAQQQKRPQQLGMQQPVAPTTIVVGGGSGKYGEKNGSTVRTTPPRSGTRKPRWGRFVRTICCCVTPNRERQPEKTPVKGAPSRDALNSPTGTAPSLPGGNPITQMTKQSPPLGSGMIPGAPHVKATPSSNPITQISQHGEGSLNGGTAYPQPEIMPPGTIYKPALERLLLPPVQQRDANRKCLIIDLDETLVHSSFKPVKNPDFVIPVEIDGIVHQVYVLKRPYVDEFLARVGEKFECVLFTASLAKYADPVADLLDKRGVFRARLFREACVFHKGNYIKDLARLGRDLNRTIIVDNSPTSYAFHPDNAIPVQTWFDDPHDVELVDILPLLDRLAQVDSVYSVLRHSNSSPDSAALLDRPYS